MRRYRRNPGATTKDLQDLLSVAGDAAEELGREGLANLLRYLSGQEGGGLGLDLWEWFERVSPLGRGPLTQLLQVVTTLLLDGPDDGLWGLRWDVHHYEVPHGGSTTIAVNVELNEAPIAQRRQEELQPEDAPHSVGDCVRTHFFTTKNGYHGFRLATPRVVEQWIELPREDARWLQIRVWDLTLSSEGLVSDERALGLTRRGVRL